jgi:hypothetical protein
VLVCVLAVLPAPVMAHAGGLGSRATGSAPFWFVLMVGGAIIAATFLFTSLLTDHEAIRTVNGWSVSLPVPGQVSAVVAGLGGGLSLLVFGLIVVTGLFGPAEPTRSFAIVVVWGLWWAGYVMSVYLLGNSWPVVNPWRRLAAWLPDVGESSYPARLGSWPATVGLLGLVWLEVISPVADHPRLLSGLVVVYTVVTLGGAAVFGVETWFSNVDPIAGVFHWYGRIAPVQRTTDGLTLRLPVTAAAEDGFRGEFDDVAFVVALLWATTYDGLVTTPPWATAVRWVAGLGVPPLAVYLVTIAVGYGIFIVAYRVASRKARDVAGTAVTGDYIGRWLVPSLLPIAAGYHLAHFLGYFISLLPAVLAVIASPLSPPVDVHVFVLPGWYRRVQLLFVLLGHVVAIWVAHSLSFELFPGSIQPIRSQYSYVVVMIFYTMVSMWIIAQPFTPPPYL